MGLCREFAVAWCHWFGVEPPSAWGPGFADLSALEPSEALVAEGYVGPAVEGEESACAWVGASEATERVMALVICSGARGSPART